MRCLHRSICKYAKRPYSVHMIVKSFGQLEYSRTNSPTTKKIKIRRIILRVDHPDIHMFYLIELSMLYDIYTFQNT
jgi:hypothetical protein